MNITVFTILQEYNYVLKFVVIIRVLWRPLDILNPPHNFRRSKNCVSFHFLIFSVLFVLFLFVFVILIFYLFQGTGLRILFSSADPRHTSPFARGFNWHFSNNINLFVTFIVNYFNDLYFLNHKTIYFLMFFEYFLIL